MHPQENPMAFDLESFKKEFEELSYYMESARYSENGEQQQVRLTEQQLNLDESKPNNYKMLMP